MKLLKTGLKTAADPLHLSIEYRIHDQDHLNHLEHVQRCHGKTAAKYAEPW